MLAKKPFTHLAAPIGGKFSLKPFSKGLPPEARIIVSSASSHLNDKLQFINQYIFIILSNLLFEKILSSLGDKVAFLSGALSQFLADGTYLGALLQWVISALLATLLFVILFIVLLAVCKVVICKTVLGLNDNYVSGLARGNEWRTTPLWGIGLQEKVNGHTYFLHDGRARNLLEAIMWHGGEGEASKNLFKQMPKEDRDALIKFLESL